MKEKEYFIKSENSTEVFSIIIMANSALMAEKIFYEKFGKEFPSKTRPAISDIKII
jgi:hypothetical protein